MLVEALERLILVVIAGDVGAQAAKVVELLLNLLGGSLHVGFDASQVLLVVHLGAGVSHDSDILGQELVSVLRSVSNARQRLKGQEKLTKPKSAGYCESRSRQRMAKAGLDRQKPSPSSSWPGRPRRPARRLWCCP